MLRKTISKLIKCGILGIPENSNKKQEKLRKEFRLKGKNFKLTYAYKSSKNNDNEESSMTEKQTFIKSKEILHNHLIGLFQKVRANIKLLVTAHEISDENYKHYHVLLCLDRQIDTTDPRYFDFHQIHGDYQTIKGSVHKWLGYCKKDGDYKVYTADKGHLQYGNEETINMDHVYLYITEEIIRIKKDKRYKHKGYLSVPELCYKVIEKLDSITKIKLAREGKFISIITENLRLIKPELVMDIPTHQLKDFIVPEIVQIWAYSQGLIKQKPEVLSKLPDSANYKNTSESCLAIHGPSGIGKTKLGQAVSSTPLIVRNNEAFKQYLPGVHTCIIMDDNADLKSMSKEQMIDLLDRDTDATISVKHGNKVIPKKVPIIITTNDDPMNMLHASCYEETRDNDGNIIKQLKPEISRRLMFAYIKEPLYKNDKVES